MHQKTICIFFSIISPALLSSCQDTLNAIQAGVVDGLRSGITSGLASPGNSAGGYSYTPQPQYRYVQGPAHHPVGGYTQQPQPIYVQNPAHQSSAGYTSTPPPVYVQYQQSSQRTDNYVSSQPQKYIEYPHKQAPQNANSQAFAPRYVTNTKNGFLLPPGKISNPMPEIQQAQAAKYDAAVKQIPWYYKLQFWSAKAAVMRDQPVLGTADKVNTAKKVIQQVQSR